MTGTLETVSHCISAALFRLDAELVHCPGPARSVVFTVCQRDFQGPGSPGRLCRGWAAGIQLKWTAAELDELTLAWY